jgi:hypothetical protein
MEHAVKLNKIVNAVFKKTPAQEESLGQQAIAAIYANDMKTLNRLVDFGGLNLERGYTGGTIGNQYLQIHAIAAGNEAAAIKLANAGAPSVMRAIDGIGVQDYVLAMQAGMPRASALLEKEYRRPKPLGWVLSRLT